MATSTRSRRAGRRVDDTARSAADDAHEDLPLGAALDFMRRVWALNHALERVSSQMVRTHGITAQQRLIIRCVGRYPGMTPSQLARLLHLDAGTVSAALARLERGDLLVRRRDPRDRRRVTLGLTPRGRALDHPSTAKASAPAATSSSRSTRSPPS